MAKPSAGTLEHNVRVYGAKGDGSTDDTAAVQTALDTASASGGGNGCAYFPPGDYKITSTVTVDNTADGFRISGAGSSNPDTGASRPGAKIIGSINGPLLQQNTGSPTNSAIVFENLMFNNTHATGTCVAMDAFGNGGGFYQCGFMGHKGIILTEYIHTAVIQSCLFRRGSATYAGSRAIETPSHTAIYAPDINGYERGISTSGPGMAVVEGRIEVCGTGIYWGNNNIATSGVISGVYFEANDTCILLNVSYGTTVSGCYMYGTVGSPSSGSLYGLRTNETVGTTIVGCREFGTHATAAFEVIAHASRATTGFINCSAISSWVVADKRSLTIIGCSTVADVIRAPVIATGSLPAAGSNEDGRMVIEDNGTGDRNLILYAGGQRFRIDGGAAI